MLNFIVKFSKLLTCLILLSLCVYSSDDHDEKENKRVIPGTPPAAHKKKYNGPGKLDSKRGVSEI